MGLTAEAYARQLKALLPRGAVWRVEPDSFLSSLLLGAAEELARVDGRGEQLAEEWDPRTATETIADWERVLGLPELGQALPADLAGRRVLAAAKVAAQGGQTAAYFVALAAAAGFPGAWVDEPAAHTWRMHVDLDLATVTHQLVAQEFRAGASRAGDRVASWTVPELEIVIRRYAPAHTVAWFLYT